MLPTGAPETGLTSCLANVAQCVIDCYEEADKVAALAKSQPHNAEFYLAAEKRWIFLAHQYELTERLVRMEGHADEIHDAGLKKAFIQFGDSETMKFVVVREIYKHLERIVDALEDVANEIDGIVIDHA